MDIIDVRPDFHWPPEQSQTRARIDNRCQYASQIQAKYEQSRVKRTLHYKPSTLLFLRLLDGDPDSNGWLDPYPGVRHILAYNHSLFSKSLVAFFMSTLYSNGCISGGRDLLTI